MSLNEPRVLDCIIPVARAAFSTARAASPDFGSVSRTLLGAETERCRRRAAYAGSQRVLDVVESPASLVAILRPTLRTRARLNEKVKRK